MLWLRRLTWDDEMKGFSNASFSPDTVSIMKGAMDAAVATLPDPVRLVSLTASRFLSARVMPRRRRNKGIVWLFC
jgi:hypothetical protein